MTAQAAQIAAIRKNRGNHVPGARPALSIQDAAHELGVSPKTIRRRIADGTVPAFRVGRQIRIRPADLESAFQPIPSARVGVVR